MVGAGRGGGAAGSVSGNSIPIGIMPDTLVLLGWVGAILSLLLSVIAYFLKLLIQDFRQIRDQFQVLKEAVIRLESQQEWVKSVRNKGAVSRSLKGTRSS